MTDWIKKRALALAVLLSSGCVFLDVARQQALSDASIRLTGILETTAPDAGPLVALLVRWPDDGAPPELVDHFVLLQPGPFYFSAAEPGTYSVAAFLDRNRNLEVDLDEPSRRSQPETTFRMAPGDTREGIRIVLAETDRAPISAALDVRELEREAFHDRVGTTMGQLGVAGEVVPLEDPRLGRENGDLGLWRPFDFVLEVGAGVYFLEPYDPARIPVLFVHGVGGSPQEFAPLIEGLDRTRYQPWVFFYPSGGKLQRIAEFLSRVLSDLEVELGFERLHVVAHSMGGLVARGALLHHTGVRGSRTPQLLVTISTPWKGHTGATLGVKYAPEVVYSWVDVAPGSEYLNGLFYHDAPQTERRRLPDFMTYHLFFGFRRDDSLPGVCSDRVVSVASELLPEAQDEAATIYGYDADHVEILTLEETSARLNGLLASAR